MYEFNSTIIEDEKTEKLLNKFKHSFVNESYPERILLINHLNNIERKIPIDEISSINIPTTQKILFYHERLKKLYYTSFEEICSYIDQLEPWEDVDCLIFDESFDWFIGITHNDSILLSGI